LEKVDVSSGAARLRENPVRAIELPLVAPRGRSGRLEISVGHHVSGEGDPKQREAEKGEQEMGAGGSVPDHGQLIG
jgi:hypothetical protein